MQHRLTSNYVDAFSKNPTINSTFTTTATDCNCTLSNVNITCTLIRHVLAIIESVTECNVHALSMPNNYSN